MEHSWDIIIWMEENAIDYIPTSWGNDEKTKYKYPVGKNSLKIKKLIDSNADLPEGQFYWLDAICKAESVKDLQMAKDMCEKGTYTSNIESDEDGDSKRKRRRKVRTLTSDSESSDDHTPLARGQNLIRKKFTAPSVNIEPRVESNMAPISATPKSIVLGNSQCSFRRTATPTSSQTPNFRDVGQFASGSKQVSADLTPILQELTQIKYYMKESRAILSRMEAFMNSHDSNQIQSNDHANILLENSDSVVKKLPCQTKEQLEEVDTMIQEPIHMKELVIFLYLAGGHNPHKSVYMAMQKIFARDLSVLYSGQGKKKKIPFCSMKIYEAVVAAVRKRHSSVTDESVKKSVSLFLATAKSRLSMNKQTATNREMQHLEEF